MPIKAVGVTLQQSPMSFIYRADAARPTKIEEVKGSKIAITAGDASLAIFTAFLGKLNMQLSDVQLITVANPQAKEQAVLNKTSDALLGYFMDQGPRMQLQSGVKMGWTRLYDMAGVTTLSSAIIVNNDWLKDAKNQDRLKRFLRASQRGWQYTFDNRDEAAEIFMKHAPAFNKEISLLEINGTLSITNTKHTQGKPLFWSAKEDWQESQDLLEKYADYDGGGANENAKFDWFEVGGRFGDALPLKRPRQLKRFFGLLPGDSTSKAVSARKSEINQVALLADPPAALLFRERWAESEIMAKGKAAEKWRTEFARLFAEIPEDTALTVVDCHS
jgi:ABC-type nitrate/sulfonate/bicarbonate transport system substrate-binding protein